MDMLSQMSGSLRSPACHRRALLTDSITEGASDIARLSVSPLFQKCWLSAYSQILPGQAERDRSGKIVSPVRGCLNRYLEKQTQQNGGGGRCVDTRASWVFCPKNMSDFWKEMGKGVKIEFPAHLCSLLYVVGRAGLFNWIMPLEQLLVCVSLVMGAN